MCRKIPFIDQLAKVDPSCVEKEYGFINDSAAAARFGVRFFEEFSYWAWRSCGIANVAMILAAEGKFVETLYDLICETLLDCGYAFKNRRGGRDIGWKYSSLCDLLKRRGLSTKIYRYLPLEEAAVMLDRQCYVILSIKSATGGHMLLAKSIVDGFIIYNDPYVFAGKGGEDVRESLESFGTKFLERGIVVW